MGTPEFAAVSLKELVAKGFELVGVYTNPDKPFGRKQIVTPCAVKMVAESFKIKVFQPEKISAQDVEILKELKPDAIVVVAYGKILPAQLLKIPVFGCFNVHASLLPKYRGASPIQSSIINCEKETGVSIILMTPRMDDGDVLKVVKVPIGLNETYLELSEKLSYVGAKAICDVLNDVSLNNVTRTPQDDEKASYVYKINKDVARINFNLAAFSVHKLICGLSGYYEAYCYLNGKILKVHKSLFKGSCFGAPGEILDEKRFVVSCKEGAVEFLKVQLQGRKQMLAKDFLNGCRIKKGDFLS